MSCFIGSYCAGADKLPRPLAIIRNTLGALHIAVILKAAL
jgi:hypothetical protein